MARDTRRRLEALARELEPDLRRSFLRAVADIKSSAQMTLLIEALEAGNADDAIRILQIRPETFQALDDAMVATFLRGAAYQIDSVPKKLEDPVSGGRLIVRFQGTQPRAQQIASRLGAELVTAIDRDQKQAIRSVVRQGIQEGRGAETIALDLVGRIGASGRRTGGIIGLTERDALTVQKYRSALLSGDRDLMQDYLNLKGRDKRLDGAVIRAIDGGRGLSQEEVNRRMQRLSDRYLRNRGNIIARTETIPALNAGRREATQQMIDRGVIPASAVKRKWDATGDARTRPDHMQMEGQEVRWDQPFVAPDGSRLMGPGDNSLGASADQVIGCRCYEKIEVDYLALAGAA